jgi:hypothetical protein
MGYRSVITLSPSGLIRVLLATFTRKSQHISACDLILLTKYLEALTALAPLAPL